MNKKREKVLFYSLLALGISSIITQLITIREFLSVFYGNELVMGIILANWFLLTGTGAYLGKYAGKLKDKILFLIICQTFISVLPFFYIVVIRILRNTVFPIGTLIGITQIFLSSLLLLLPYCIVSGFLLALFCVILKQQSMGKVYFVDTTGGIIGGLLFSFIFIFILSPFQTSFFIMWINLTAALFLSVYFQIKHIKPIVILLLLASFLIIFIDLNTITNKVQYKNQEVIFQKNSIYGNIVITKTEEQLNFFENGIPLFTTDNTISNEETVHYVMSQHENPENILLISGGVAGTTNELLKYNIAKIDYVELDPLIIELGKKYTSNLKNEKIHIINQDARLFVKRTIDKYDIVIIDLPDPSTAYLNRFYTVEFFTDIKKILNRDGVISLSLSSSGNYMARQVIQLDSALYNSLKTNFKNVIIIPGYRDYFISSDNDLTYGIGQKIKEKGINTEYVNDNYLTGILTKDRINYILGSIDKTVKVNKDFNPVSYYYHLIYWFSQFRFNYYIFLIIILIAIVLYLTKIKPVPFAIFTTGFAASSLEVILLIGFQILYGYVYHKIGIIITTFMLGLGIGSCYINKRIKLIKFKLLIKVHFLIVIFSILFPIILLTVNNFENNALIFLSSEFLIPLLALILAVLVGMEFPLASRFHFSNAPAAELYNADFIGACIGALLISALLVPFLGLFRVCLIIAALNAASGTILIIKRKKYK